jgi:hypothetical protein
MKEYLITKILHAEPRKSWYGDRDGYLLDEEWFGMRWLHKAEFEANCRPTDGMTFGQALEALKLGKKVARKNWIDRFMVCDQLSETTYPAFEIYSNTGGFIQLWRASAGDVLADDWQIVD